MRTPQGQVSEPSLKCLDSLMENARKRLFWSFGGEGPMRTPQGQVSELSLKCLDSLLENARKRLLRLHCSASKLVVVGVFEGTDILPPLRLSIA